MNRLRDERGSALLLAMIVLLMLAAAGAAAMLTARIESLLGTSSKQSQEALFAAEGGLARAIQDLSPLSDWSAVLAGSLSTFQDGSPTGTKQLPGGDPVVLCCGSGSLTDDLQQRAYGGTTRGANTPQWRLFAWGSLSSLLLPGQSSSAFYVAVWISDDIEDGDGDPLRDANGRVVLNATGLGPGRARRSIQATLRHAQRADGTPLGHGAAIVSSHESRW